jgi:hypothetical protein
VERQEQYDPILELAFKISQLFGVEVKDLFIVPQMVMPLLPPQDIRKTEALASVFMVRYLFPVSSSLPEFSPRKRAPATEESMVRRAVLCSGKPHRLSGFGSDFRDFPQEF